MDTVFFIFSKTIYFSGLMADATEPELEFNARGFLQPRSAAPIPSVRSGDKVFHVERTVPDVSIISECSSGPDVLPMVAPAAESEFARSCVRPSNARDVSLEKSWDFLQIDRSKNTSTNAEELFYMLEEQRKQLDDVSAAVHRLLQSQSNLSCSSCVCKKCGGTPEATKSSVTLSVETQTEEHEKEAEKKTVATNTSVIWEDVRQAMAALQTVSDSAEELQTDTRKASVPLTTDQKRGILIEKTKKQIRHFGVSFLDDSSAGCRKSSLDVSDLPPVQQFSKRIETRPAERFRQNMFDVQVDCSTVETGGVTMYGMTTRNVSFATQKYLMKYGLMDGQQDTSLENVSHSSEEGREAVLTPREKIAEPVAVQENQASMILDIQALRQLPKLL